MLTPDDKNKHSLKTERISKVKFILHVVSFTQINGNGISQLGNSCELSVDNKYCIAVDGYVTDILTH